MSSKETVINDFGIYADKTLLTLISRHMSMRMGVEAQVDDEVLAEFQSEDFFDNLAAGYFDNCDIDTDMVCDDMRDNHLVPDCYAYSDFTGSIVTLGDIVSAGLCKELIDETMDEDSFLFIPLNLGSRLVGESYHTVQDIINECQEKLSWLMDDIRDSGFDLAGHICGISGTIYG